MEELVLYLILKADSVLAAAHVTVAFSSFVVFTSGVIALICYVDYEERSLGPAGIVCIAACVILVVSSFAAIVVPDTKQLSIILGVPAALRSEQAQRIGDLGNKLLDRLERRISEEE